MNLPNSHPTIASLSSLTTVFVILLLFATAFWPFSVANDDNHTAIGTTEDPLGQKCNFSGPGHCPTGFICQQHQCVRRCFFMGNCPDGFFCKHNFICVKKECTKGDLNCCPHCPESCIKHENCPIGWGCVFGKCRRVECRATGDCEFGWPCVVGKCFPPACANDDECPEEWKCGPTRRCAKKETEKSDEEDEKLN